MDAVSEMDFSLTVRAFTGDEYFFNACLSPIRLDASNKFINFCFELRQWYETGRIQGNDE